MTATKLPVFKSRDEVKGHLLELGRIAQVFMEGDLCRQLLQPYAEKFMIGDDLDLSPAACVPVKKTIMRLERVSKVPCAIGVWRQRPDMPDRCEPLLYGRASSPGIDKPPNRGYQPPAMFPEFKSAFFRNKPAFLVTPKVHVLRKRGVFSSCRDVKEPLLLRLFVPIKDSMGDIAAVLEIMAQLAPTKPAGKQRQSR